MAVAAVLRSYWRGKMRLQDISSELRSRVAKFRWDRIIEKHEGPEDWEYLIEDDYVDFLHVDEFNVLLPVDKTCQHQD